MFLSVTTTHRLATDLGFLLMKHPDRVHEFELSFGKGPRCFALTAEVREPAGCRRSREEAGAPS